MTPRTLRCANFRFYLGVIALVAAACVYTLLRPQQELWQTVAAVAGMGVTLLWGGSYLALRYQVDAAGITRRTLLGGRRIEWAEIRSARLETSRTPGVESKALLLEAPACTLRLGSELLDPDDIDALVRDLRDTGLAVEE